MVGEEERIDFFTPDKRSKSGRGEGEGRGKRRATVNSVYAMVRLHVKT